MEFIEQVLTLGKDEIYQFITDRINELNKTEEEVTQLGFLEFGKINKPFEGFIPLDTRIKYHSMALETYSMNSTDFLYEFVNFVRKYNINSKASLIHNLAIFIDSYFGRTYADIRESVFNEIAWTTTATDEEYFEALRNNKIGDLRGKNAAMCTERAALAQQVLSLFGFETFFCVGSISYEKGSEAHAFNVVKRKNDYALVDYSVCVNVLNEKGEVHCKLPFVGTMSEEDFNEFINTSKLKSFEEYYFEGFNNRVVTDKNREYSTNIEGFVKARGK